MRSSIDQIAFMKFII